MTELQAFLFSAVIAATPLLFATLGEIMIEKSGNLNLGVEGMMMLGAVAGFYGGMATSNPLFALLAAALAGMLAGLLFSLLTVTLRANQIVTGLAITIFGAGLSKFLGQNLIGKTVPKSLTEFFAPREIPLLSQIPVIGKAFFSQNYFVYLGIIIAILIGIYLYRTHKGLNLTIIGENPGVADAQGVHVARYKYIHIAIGGALCGLGGAYLSLVYVPAWQDNIVSGRGWIANALVIFCVWNPYKAMLGALFFGALDIIGFRLQKYQIPISQYIIDLLPYLLTIVVLVISAAKKDRKHLPPEGLGVPYFREER